MVLELFAAAAINILHFSYGCENNLIISGSFDNAPMLLIVKLNYQTKRASYRRPSFIDLHKARKLIRIIDKHKTKKSLCESINAICTEKYRCHYST